MKQRAGQRFSQGGNRRGWRTHTKTNEKKGAGVFLGTTTGRIKVIRLRLALKSHRKGKQNGSWAMAG